MRRPFLRCLRLPFAALLLTGAFAAPACSGSRGPDIVTRMNNAKGMAEGFGFSAFGAPSTGTVEEGKESKVPLALKEGCYQIFAFAGDGLKGLDLGLNDPSGKSVGTASKQEGQSSIKQCVTDAGTYTLVVKSSGGSGSFIAQPYASAVKDGTTDPNNGGECEGPDCPDPIDPSMGGGDDCSGGMELGIGGVTKGSTAKKGGNIHLTCAASDGPVAVYRTHVDGRHKLVVDLNAKFDAIMGIYRAANDGYLCDSVNELECSDDSEGLTTKSHIETVVDTGDYGVIIGGFDGDRGEFEVKAQLTDAPSLETICAGARSITPGTKLSDVIDGNGSNFHASCSNGEGDEALYKLDLKSRSRLRIAGKGTAGELTLSLRGRCDDPSSEVACTTKWHFDSVSWTGLMNAGAYTLIADTSDMSHSGTIDLNVDSAPDGGDGTAEADACKDARAITSSTTPISIDTFHAKGDLKASCAADSAADVVYKIDVKTKSRIFVSANGNDDEGRHVVALQKACGDTKGELGCELLTGKGLDATVDPGTYFLVVKGKGTDDFGRAKITVRTRELGEVAKVCKSAPKLVSGTAVSDTTTGAPDRFVSTNCGGPVAQQQSGDKVYQFTLKDRSKVHLELKNPGSFYNAIMSLRSDCADPTKGEIVCSNQYSKILDRDLDAGTYYVVVDGFGPKSEGAYTIEMTSKPIK
jgi:hypothetical protein